MIMMGTMFCQYETPCGWCVRLNVECPKHGTSNGKRSSCSGKNSEENLLNPAGEYAIKFAKNHGISVAEAMEHPMVKARFEYFSQTGA